jgi:putative tricarboxylic transport membrane protein
LVPEKRFVGKYLKGMKKVHHQIGSIFWLVVGAFVIIHANQLGLGRLRNPGPGFIFFLSALILVSLAAIDLVVTFFGKAKKEDAKEPIWGPRWKKVLLVLGALSVYIYLFNFLGFLLSTFLLLVFLFKAVEPTKWWIAIASSLVTILISYCLFNRWLMVPFPSGILGF